MANNSTTDAGDLMSRENAGTTEGRDSRGRFAAGVSGNPAGRPRGSVGLLEAIRAELAKTADGSRTMAERIADALVRQAAEGDLRAIQIVCDRVEGRPRAAAEEASPTKRIEFKPMEF